MCFKLSEISENFHTNCVYEPISTVTGMYVAKHLPQEQMFRKTFWGQHSLYFSPLFYGFRNI